MGAMEFIRGGLRMHIVVADDPLEMGAVKIETGEWCLPHCEDWEYYHPLKGQQVIVATMLEDNKLYWFGIFNGIE